MPVDSNIPLAITNPPPINPLATLAGVQSYQTNALQQKVLGSQIGSNQAQSDAIRANVKPDGTVDWGGAASTGLQDPRLGYNALPFAQATQALQTGQVGLQSAGVKLDSDQLANAQSHLNWAYQTASAVANNPNATTDDVFNAIRQSVKNGQITPQIASQAISDMPPPGAPAGALQRWAANHAAQAAGAASQLGLAQPSISTVDTGSGIQQVATDKLSGAPTVTGTFNKTLSPTEQMARVPTVGPNGAAGSVPQGSLAPPNLLPPGAAGASAGGAGRYPGTGTAPAVAGAPGGFLPISLAPGVAQAADVAGTASGQQMVDDQKANAGSGQRVYQLQSALTGLQGAGPTGPGTETTNQIASFLQSQVPFGLGKYLPGVDPSKIASYDEANKYLTQYAAAKAGAMGGGTDAKLATTLSGNASTHISGLAAQDVVKANIGLERMGQAQQDAFAASGLPAAQYTTFASKFGSTIDPRVFIADQMEPAKVATLVQKMNPKDQAQFKTQYNWAVQKGYINGPQ